MGDSDRNLAHNLALPSHRPTRYAGRTPGRECFLGKSRLLACRFDCKSSYTKFAHCESKAGEPCGKVDSSSGLAPASFHRNSNLPFLFGNFVCSFYKSFAFLHELNPQSGR